MIEIAIVAFTTFFATISPLEVGALFAVLTVNTPTKARRTMALRGIVIATGILLLFAFFGGDVLGALNIGLPAFTTAGGILLLIIGIEMVFARSSGVLSTTEEEKQEAMQKQDIAVFPLAMPLIAGPGSMGAVMLLIAEAKQQNFEYQFIVIGMLLLVILLTFISLLLAGQINKILGQTGLQVIARIFGVLLSALAVQFIFTGLESSRLFISLQQ